MTLICLLSMLCFSACGEIKNNTDTGDNVVPEQVETIVLDENTTITLNDIENKGYKYQGYEKYGADYTFIYSTATRSYSVIADVPEELQEPLHKLNMWDADFNEKWNSIKVNLVVSEMMARNEEPISKEILSQYVGQSVSILFEDEFNLRGKYTIYEETFFIFAKDMQAYRVTLDDPAYEIDMFKFETDNEYRNEVSNYIIKTMDHEYPL